MRVRLFPLILVPMVLLAQPEPPPISFTLAEGLSPAAPLLREHRVELHFRYAAQYGYGEHLNGTPLMFALQGAHLFADSATGWQRYEIPATWDTDLRMLVIAVADTMQLALPELGNARYALIERAWSRWDRATPEVIRFRKGHFAFEEVIKEPGAEEVSGHFAERLIAEEDIRYKEGLVALEEYYLNQPPAAPPSAPYIPPPPMTEAEWATFWAEQPPLKDARIDRVNADTVWVRFSGRVMLNGDCASGMPLFGIEMRTSSGWVERIPFDHTQMDCGLPWADWEDHVVMLPPLRWWVGVHQPEGKKEVLPGSYRLIFMGGNMQEYRTAAFEILE